MSLKHQFKLVALLVVSLILTGFAQECSNFRSVSYGGGVFQQTTQAVTWSTTQRLCNLCFSGIATISASVVSNERNNSNFQLWVGSYNGGEVINNLVWFTSTGQVVVLFDGVLRFGLCNPSPSPQPTPQPPSPTPTVSPTPQPTPQPPTPTQQAPAPTPQPPTPTQQPTPQPTPSPVCPPCPVCPPTPQPTPTPGPTPQPPTPSTQPSPTPTPIPAPTPTKQPSPSPTSGCNFERKVYGGESYRQSLNTYQSWTAASGACQSCFSTKLANIFNASLTSGSTLELFVGSYQGGNITPNLVWFQATGRINEVGDNTPRRALCNSPQWEN